MSCHPPPQKKKAKLLRFFVAFNQVNSAMSAAATNSTRPGILLASSICLDKSPPATTDTVESGLAPPGVQEPTQVLRFSVSGFLQKMSGFLEIIQYFSQMISLHLNLAKKFGNLQRVIFRIPKTQLDQICRSPKTIHLHSNPSAGRTWLKAFETPRLPNKKRVDGENASLQNHHWNSALKNNKKNSRVVELIPRSIRSCCVENGGKL